MISLMVTNAQHPDVPFVPTSEAVVENMLDIAGVEEGDYLIDLGSGDGRIVIAAAKRGAFGHGVEIDSNLVKEANENAIHEGVGDRVIFVKENIFDTDFRQADVVTMYLFNSINMILRPHLLNELRPGARVVSHHFDMHAWKPDRHIKKDGRDVYLWIVPAKISGNWTWNFENMKYNMSVDQHFQEISIDILSDGLSLNVENCKLIGNKIWFNVIDTINSINYLLNGIVERDSIKGKVQVHKEKNSTFDNWTAIRNRNMLEADKQLLLNR